MARAVDGPKRKNHRKKIHKLAKGYWGSRHSSFKIAKEAVVRAGVYAYRDRRKRKSDFRRLWIGRINGSTRQLGLSYSAFMHGLTQLGITLNRKALSEMALSDPASFEALVTKVKSLQGA